MCKEEIYINMNISFLVSEFLIFVCGIQPIVITLIMILYYIFYFGLVIAIVPSIWKILLGVFPVLLIGAMIYVCVQRIKEIDGGEEDDLSNY